MERLEKVKEEIESLDVKVLALKCDVTKPSDVTNLAEKSIAEMNDIHFLFSNAGIAIGGHFENLNIIQWEKIMNLNVFGMVLFVNAFIKKLIDQGFGHIIVTASIAGLLGVGGLSPYNTTKFANVGFCESLSSEYYDKGIDVSVLCPFPIKTHLIENFGFGILPEILEGVDPELMIESINAGKAHYWNNFTKKQLLTKGFGGGFTTERSVEYYIKKIRKRKFYISERRYARIFLIFKGVSSRIYRKCSKIVGKNHINLINETFEIAVNTANKQNEGIK